MRALERILGDVIGWLSDFFLQTLMPWAWENKAWLIALIPLVFVIVLVKYLWD